MLDILSAERKQFSHSLHVLIKELKESLSEAKQFPDDMEISQICWETKELRKFQNEVRSSFNARDTIKMIHLPAVEPNQQNIVLD